MKLLPRDLLPGSLPRGVESRVISALVSRQISIPRGSSLVNGEHARARARSEAGYLHTGGSN